jgi:uncharacterized membrane protein YeaQ/YmgE (transglycosylase-associated protein family)
VEQFGLEYLRLENEERLCKSSLFEEEQTKMSIIWMLIVGGVIGWLGGVIVGRDVPGGIIGNIVAGIVGSWLGGMLLGDMGPEVGGFSIIPAILGAIVVVLILSAILRGSRRR